MVPDLTRKLQRNFYTQPVLDVAKQLPGKIFVKRKGDSFYTGRIVEVEAYDGSYDEAAHTFNGKTKRNEVMFKEGGYLYVYFTYGVHYCCNVVTGKKNEGNAVLIRAIEPMSLLEDMSGNRFGTNNFSSKQLINLTNGPGKLCKALEIERKHNGYNLTGDDIFIVDDDYTDFGLVETTRIGINKSVELPWRFYIKDSKYVSKK